MTMSTGQPAAVQLPRRAYVIFGITALTLLTFAMNGFIVSVAFPTIKQEFGTNLALVGWVFTGFQLANIVVLPMAGKLSDEFGRKRVYLASVVFFTLATLGCGLAPNVYVLVFFRILQGIGGGFIQPSATGIVSDAFGAKRQTALGLFSSIYPIGAILGPNIGGLLIDHLSWRWIFFMNVPMGVMIVFLGALLFPQGAGKQKAQPVDFVGALTYGTALFLFLFALTDLANHSNAYRTPAFWGYVAAAVVFVVLFVREERRVVSPMIDLALLRSRPFLALNAYGFLYGVAIFAVISFLPLHAVLNYHLSLTLSGFVLTPRAVLMIAASTTCAFLLSRTGYRAPMIAGALLGSLATLLLGLGLHDQTFFGNPVSDLVLLCVIMGVSGFGNGIVLPSMSNAGLDMAPGKVAAISGLVSVFSNTGAVVGTAIIILVMSHFPDQGQGLRVMMIAMAGVVLLSVPFTFMFPDLGGKRRQKAGVSGPVPPARG